MVRSSRFFARPLWVAVALVCSAWLSSPALACKCMFPPVETARDDATAVFEGRVLSVEQAPGSEATNGERRVSLRVVRTWKGLEREEQVVIFTNGSSAACGFTFAPDTSYLVYARSSDDQKLHVSSCSRSKTVAEASEDLNFLGAGSTPVAISKALVRGLDGGAPSELGSYVDGGSDYAPKPVPASATPTAAVSRKKSCSLSQGEPAADAQAFLLALPLLALLARRVGAVRSDRSRARHTCERAS